jgi:hypothetical protein
LRLVAAAARSLVGAAVVPEARGGVGRRDSAAALFGSAVVAPAVRQWREAQIGHQGAAMVAGVRRQPQLRADRLAEPLAADLVLVVAPSFVARTTTATVRPITAIMAIASIVRRCT